LVFEKKRGIAGRIINYGRLKNHAIKKSSGKTVLGFFNRIGEKSVLMKHYIQLEFIESKRGGSKGTC